MEGFISYVCRIGAPQWEQIYAYLSEVTRIYVRNEASCRRFVAAVHWVVKSVLQWCLLPSEYGNWNTVYKGFSDWAKKGIWNNMLCHFQSYADIEYIMIGLTVLRAHACAAPKKTSKNEKGLDVLVKGFQQRFMPYAMH